MGYILSVAIPCYNVQKYLDKCLTSLSNPAFSGRLDVMIINDGSTDNTPEIAQGYVDKFPKIFRLINKENGGHGSAVNTGIENARGKYFRIVDGDDWIKTENMTALLDVLEKTEADMVIDEKREVNMQTKDTEFFPLGGIVEFNKLYKFEDICSNDDIITHIMLHTLSIKTEILRKHNIHLLEGIFYVDIEFIIKSTIECKTALFVDLEIYEYLVGNANQSVNYKNYVKRYSDHDEVTRELIRFGTSKQGLSNKFQAYLDRRVTLLIATHMNISLIYNEDRALGLKQAKEFRTFLKDANLKYYKLATKRYLECRVLHALGLDYNKLQRIKRRK